MGDTDHEKTTESNVSDQAEIKTSIDILKEAKPSANIAIEKTEREITNEDDKSKTSPVPSKKIETVFEKPESKVPTDPEEVKNIPGEKVPQELKSSKKDVAKNVVLQNENDSPRKTTTGTLKNRSDIFSITDQDKGANIFSITGVPSKRSALRTSDNPTHNMTSSSHIFGLESETSSHPKTTTPSDSFATVSQNTILTSESAGSKMDRNPLTGAGVNSNDEYKSKPQKRKDGNPVTGLGYTDRPPVGGGNTGGNTRGSNTRGNSTRIPPGGYSQGLW